MKITIHNKLNLPNKYVRLLKWRLYRLQEKFESLKSVEIYLDSEGQSKKVFIATVSLKTKYRSFVIRNQDTELNKLWSKSFMDAQRYIRKSKERLLSFRHNQTKSII